jgi:hypothetical protein
LLSNPFLDLLEVDLEDLGREVGDEGLGYFGIIDLVVLAERRRVAVPVGD